MGTAERGILIIGHRGLLGRELMCSFQPRHPVCGLDQGECDVRDPAQIDRALDALRPRVVINAAAYTDVDGCESAPELAFAVNARGAGNVARACRARRIFFICLSTDFIFDGSARRPYTESDVPRPLSVYGLSKLAGEEEVHRAGGKHLIVRTAWLFGKGGKNFPDTILKRVRASGELAVVDDQVGCPTYAVDLAWAIGELVRCRAEGTVNVTNRGSCSWYEYACYIVKVAGLKAEVRPASSLELRRPAPRPPYSVLSPRLFEKITGDRMRSWRAAIREYIRSKA